MGLLPFASEQFGNDVVLGGRQGKEPSQPVHQHRRKCFSASRPDSLTDEESAHPANAAKLEAPEVLGALADWAGMTLIQMALTFVTRHPAGTIAIISPRTIAWTLISLPMASNYPTIYLTRIDQIFSRGHDQRGRQHVAHQDGGTHCDIPPSGVIDAGKSE
jgi:hypothetical protein